MTDKQNVLAEREKVMAQHRRECPPIIDQGFVVGDLVRCPHGRIFEAWTSDVFAKYPQLRRFGFWEMKPLEQPIRYWRACRALRRASE
jgi:hypothetical protein